MKIISFSVVACCALWTAAASGQISLSVNEPVNGGIFTSPLTISATASSPNKISGWAVYTDSQLSYRNTDTSGRINTTFSVPAGSHTVVVKAFDNSGASQPASESITVNSSPMPTPPTSAITYSNLQNTAGNPGIWTACTSKDGCAGQTYSGSGILTPGQTSPALSGGSMVQSSAGSYFNTMFYRHLGCPNNNCNAIQNMLEDVWFQPTSVQNVQQLEFDPDLFDTANYEYFGTVACRLQGTSAGHWFVWNMSGSGTNPQGTNGNGAWVVTPYTCTATTVAAGAWHHVQLYITFDTVNKTYSYQTLAFDGVTVFQNLGQLYHAYQLPMTQTPTVNIEQQIDNSNVNGTNSAYYDNYNLSVW